MKRFEREDITRLAKECLEIPVYPDPRFPPSIYYRFLYALAHEGEPALSVELGVCGGGGSLHLSLGYPEGQVIGVDVSNEWPHNIKHVQKVCPNFIFLRNDSLDASKVIVPGTVGILFIDTTHTYDRTVAEVGAWGPLMHPNGIVILDDLFRDGMLDAWADIFPEREKIRLDELHLGGSPSDGGLGVILL